MADDDVHVPVEKGGHDMYSNSDERIDIKMTTLGRFRYALRDYLAEFWGTFILIAFGDGVVIQTVLSNSVHGNQITINICWGIAVIMGIYTSGGISGAHLNPAVTLTLAIFRKFPWKKVLGYWIAQGAGAFLAAALLYVNFIQAFNAYDGGLRAVPNLGLPNATAGVFSTYPALFMTMEGAFFDQVVTTGILVFGVFAINDMGNTGAGSLGPLMVGFLVMAVGMAFGWQTGYAVNPARDMGPRMFAFFVYGSDVFTAGSSLFSGYAWIPIIGPLVGAPLGAFLYDLFMFTGEGPLQGLFRRP